MPAIIFSAQTGLSIFRQILIENGGATGVEYVQDGEKRITKLAVGGEVTREHICGRGRNEEYVHS